MVLVSKAKIASQHETLSEELALAHPVSVSVVSMSLPALVRTPADSPREVVIVAPSNGASLFDRSVESLLTVDFPILDTGISVKDRIAKLESTAGSQNVENKLIYETFNNLNSNLISTDDNIRDIIQHVKDITDATMAAMKKEYDHK